MEKIISIIFELVILYFCVGFIFSLFFLSWGVSRIDPAAKDSSIAFRIFILPGTLIFWPLLSFRWLTGKKTPPVEKGNAHRKSERSNFP